ncbi:MAG: hypothetical protein JNJ60_23185 [Rhodocyclaceae bacterium]|nr:hypothetical protein [Rhodocyclaceae bacterium]
MKNLLGLSMVALGVWWLFVGGTPLVEGGVRDFYEREVQAVLSRKPEALCELLDASFQATQQTTRRGVASELRLDRDAACKAARDTFATFDAVGTQMGGVLELDYRLEIEALEIDPQGKQASVEISYVFDIAGGWMVIRGSRSDRLVRRLGRTRLVESSEITAITGGL